jgi:predicted ATP-grasp superfamily ATP-dependent carboligase
MAAAVETDTARGESQAQGERAVYDILILDAAWRIAVTIARSLGRAGLRVALADGSGYYRPEHQPPSFSSRYCADSAFLPDYNSDPQGYVDAIFTFAREHQVKAVLPTADSSIVLMAPHRERFAEIGCTVAVASDAALEIANDKVRTLEVASKLGIDYPKSVAVTGVEDLRKAEAEFGYPMVIKPTMSWTGKVAERVQPVEAITEAEAMEATTRFLGTGCEVLAQQLASGRRESISLFILGGEMLAYCGATAHRTTPPLGGVSVMRESIPVPDDLLTASVNLATAIGLEGPCEVEYRQDARGNSLLMEINPRLAGTLENAMHSGVDLPLMTWQWATGQPVTPVRSYRTGVRTRWLAGDMRWLWDSMSNSGRPDTMSPARSIWTFTREFLRTRHYDFLDRRDIRPALASVWDTALIVRSQFAARKREPRQ